MKAPALTLEQTPMTPKTGVAVRTWAVARGGLRIRRGAVSRVHVDRALSSDKTGRFDRARRVFERIVRTTVWPDVLICPRISSVGATSPVGTIFG